MLGEVTRPGQYHSRRHDRSPRRRRPGWLTYRAINDYAGIVRLAEGTTQEGRVSRRNFIVPGDIITIYERRF